MSDLSDVITSIRAFRDERDWMQFHSPKNLASSVVIEAAELLEQFQWKTCEQSESISPEQKKQIANEIADVAIYLIELADNIGIDFSQAIRDKLALNAAKYPVEKAKGSSAKYNAQ